MAKKKNLDGAVLFDEYYQNLFGNRWLGLRDSLLGEARQVSRENSLMKPYYMDAASVIAAEALPLSGNILDMCAAPGGKTLVLASRMPEGSTLVANEFSRDRRTRLLNVLAQHLDEGLRSRVRVTGYDASKWSRFEKDAFDSILLDAPCSSERHVLSSPLHLGQWTPSRVKSLAQRQWSLASGAWLVLRAGGYLLYSTCALSDRENDDIIGKLLDKYSDCEVCENAKCTLSEKTRYGRIILPDFSQGAGPIYYALVKKRLSS